MNWLLHQREHTLTKLVQNSAETVFNQRDILGEPGERSPAFAVDYLSCASKKQRTVEIEKKRGLVTADLSHIYRIKPEWGKKGVFPSTSKGKKMDLFMWLCGCLLAFLSPSAVKAEEGGKFDTFAARSNHTVTLRC